MNMFFMHLGDIINVFPFVFDSLRIDLFKLKNVFIFFYIPPILYIPSELYLIIFGAQKQKTTKPFGLASYILKYL